MSTEVLLFIYKLVWNKKKAFVKWLPHSAVSPHLHTNVIIIYPNGVTGIE